MLERALIAAVLVGAGVIAYRVLLMTQQRRAATGSRALATTAARPALLVFTSPTCAPCKLQQLPIIDRLLPEWGERVELRIVDVTVEPDTASQFGIWSLPTTIVLDSSQQVIAINQGVASEKKLRTQIQGALEPSAPDQTFSI
ncbi:MAG: thioredoxin family protein [Anaerolineae bacterium]